MKHLFTLLCIAGLFSQAFGQTPDWLWVRGATCPTGSPIPTVQEGFSVATDRSDNVYLLGFFDGSYIAFGSDTISVANGLTGDIYLVKYSSSGQVLWARNSIAVPNSGALAYIVAADHNNNAFITGYLSGSRGDSIVFGSVVLHTVPTNSYMLVKYDSAGTALWANSDTDASHLSKGESVATDREGNIYITGTFSHAVTFDGTTLPDSSPTGSQASFIAKYDSSGHLIWARSMIGSNGVTANSIAVDMNGNAYITGIGDSVDFGNGVNTDPTANGTSPDFFLAKYNTAGLALWARHSGGGEATATGNCVATDTKGHVYITGQYTGDSMVIGPSTLYNPHTVYETYFLAQYDTSGTPRWAKGASGQANISIGYSVATDEHGAVYVTGSFLLRDTIAFDSTTIYPLRDTADPMFIVTYGSDGTLLCATALESGGDDQSGIAVDHQGNVYIGGDFEIVNPFIVGTDTLPLTGDENAFLAKYICSYKVTAGIDPLSLPVSLTVYPDPWGTAATVRYSLPEYMSSAQLIITDILGRQAATYPLGHASGEIAISSTGLSSGIYLYSLIADGRVIATGKMVIEK